MYESTDNLRKKLRRNKVGIYLCALLMIACVPFLNWIGFGLALFGAGWFAKEVFKITYELAERVGWNKNKGE